MILKNKFQKITKVKGKDLQKDIIIIYHLDITKKPILALLKGYRKNSFKKMSRARLFKIKIQIF